jgi:hypothetical protein
MEDPASDPIQRCDRGEDGVKVTQQLRVYTIKEGHLDAWTELFRRTTLPLRREKGFDIGAWAAPAKSQFYWLVSWPGSEEEFLEADKEYNAAPEHGPILEEARTHVASVESFFVDAIDC